MNTRRHQIIRALSITLHIPIHESKALLLEREKIDKFWADCAKRAMDSLENARDGELRWDLGYTIDMNNIGGCENIGEVVENMSKHIPCEGCQHYLGGGDCSANHEDECREGGGFEAWEPKKIPTAQPGRFENAVKWAAVILLAMAYPVVAYGAYQLALALMK